MIVKKQIGKLPTYIGDYVSGKSYNKKNRVTLYGSEFESKIDGNTYAPATLDSEAKTVTFDTEHWAVISNGTSAFLAGEKLDQFSFEDNPELVSAYTDDEGKLLESTDVDGKKTIYGDLEVNGKLNNTVLLDKVDKEDGKSLINEDFAKATECDTDIEGRVEIKFDSESRIIAFRDENGVWHENAGIKTKSLSVDTLNLSKNNISKLGKALREENYLGTLDWSDDKFVELPKPSVAAKVNIIASNLGGSKVDDIKGFMEYWDKQGNYFKKPIILNAQGSSSLGYWIKNQAIDIDDGSTIKFGNWVPQDSFHLKKFYIDVFRGQCVVGYWLTEQVYKTRQVGEQHPNDYLKTGATTTGGTGTFANDFESGAMFHPDGFPIMLYLNGNLQGLYALCLKKHRDNYEMKKKEHLQIHLDGEIDPSTFFNGSLDYTKFEIRNPKVDKDINGDKYDGDSPKEPSSDFQDTKDAITRLSNAYSTINAGSTDDEKKNLFEQYFNVPFYIDYELISNVIYNYDGFYKNWQWVTYDGKIWSPLLYDLDSIFGQSWNGTQVIPAGEEKPLDFGGDVTTTNTNALLGMNYMNGALLRVLYISEIKTRYKELRDNGIFTTDNIIGLLREWLNQCGYDNLKTDIEECCSYNGIPQTPSYRDGSKTYDKSPTSGGFYNSVERVKLWLNEHFKYLDKVLEYTK